MMMRCILEIKENFMRHRQLDVERFMKRLSKKLARTFVVQKQKEHEKLISPDGILFLYDTMSGFEC